MSDAALDSASSGAARPFVHLHCHTHYSLLDGANRVDQVVKKVKGAGMNALAITDHGNLYGALEFYNECRGASINPVLGLEAYIAPGSRFDKSGASRVKDACYHLTLLAMNRVGFQNLVKLSSAAYLEGFYHRPRIDKELLEAHNEGLILLSGCAAGELSQLLLGGRDQEAEKLTAWYSKVFGDRLYMEIQNAGFDIQKQCMDMTVDLANRMGLPLVATNDAHYLNQSDAAMHDVLLCVNTKVERSDINRMKMDTDQLFVRSPEEMYDAFPGFEDAVQRSQEIANRVDIDLDLKSRHYPVFQPPAGKRDIDYLRDLCFEGMVFRYGEEGITDAHRERMNFELSVIEKMGYASYFLIVWDFVRFAVEQGIPCSARGSACGALVAYVLRLSHVCPLEYDLLFERFLDPSRTEPPDIDIDFCRDRRQAVIDYTKQKYGSSNVSQIGTFGTLKAKAAIRDVARVLSVPPKDVDVIAKMVPETLNITLDEAIKESAELQDLYNRDPKIREVLDLAKQIEGLARSAGTHAAGVVVSDRPISEYIPLQTISGKTDIITQWEGPTVEKAGLLKMDFLGLRNLTILDKAVKNVKKHRGVDIDPVKLPLDDKPTFALLQRGETKGIFQLESGGMRDLLTKMKPDKFADIIATSALYRPGPLEGGMVMTYVDVKHGRLPLPRLHPIIDGVLDETYGVMVYQEQVMRILNRLGGIELPQSYQCIKAISKKKLETIAKYREQFLKGAVQNNLPEEKAIELFGMIEKFAGYGFNKSHSTAYGAVAYQTAYLKAHYPQEFMAALLSCELGETEKLVEHVDDCRRMGIAILPPDINVGDVEFSVLGDKLTFGLGAIKGVGEAAIGAIIAERDKNGPFKDLFAISERCDPKHVTKGVLELLVKAGACDSLGGRRAQQFAVIERAVQGAAAIQRDKQRGQKNLFGGDEEEAPAANSPDTSASMMPDMPEWNKREMLAFEKEALGFFLTSHPLSEMSATIKQFSTHEAKQLVDVADTETVVLGGMVSAIKKAQTKKPSRNGHQKYVNFDFEDPSGVVRCIMWPEEFARLGEKVEMEQVRFVRGKVDKRNREPNVIIDAMWTLEEVEKEFTHQVLIKFQKGLHDIRVIERVRDILLKTPGKAEVVLVVDIASSEKRTRYISMKPLEQKIAVNRDMRRELTETVGEDNIKFVADLKKKAAAGQSVGR
ncbi:DNA polymerase III subunit alpha [Schlesneria paludicola]|uniref:DNA polymerase III subunit alpha n=1 Tax=Schlesneria paludicola TaxID=360056 RepID=UPI000680D57B|nr:DNA polymerase III subunit alpha [Schlesneria paludicola]